MYFFIICILLIGLLGFQQWMHQREKRDLHNRLMSRDYPEYVHFYTVHNLQVKEEKEKLEKQREKEKREAETPDNPEEMKKKELAQDM